MDCKNEPIKFYRQLEKTRKKRADITKSMERMDEIISKHRQSVLVIRDDLSKEDTDE